ncbi:MAG: asparagine synthase (glutamine-hydrolyzing) [Gemmatimonadota bacterium]
MCGIWGIAGAACGIRARAELVDRSRDTLTHRGPDDAGSWISTRGEAALAMRRLAIVDLSPAGHQPMCTTVADAEVSLIFNGEIYNHVDIRRELAGKGYRFKGHSDTEVILSAYLEWGVDCISRFVGMFAIAIYDERTEQLILVRDRAGEKPMFYHRAPGRITFGSELKSILEDDRVPRRMNRHALNSYLAYGYVPSNGCILDGFRKLPQAHVLVYDVRTDTVRMWPYWQIPLCPPSRVSAEELSEELEHLLSRSVSAQLEADVPVGVMLSGGIDSSLVAALAVRASNDVHTFTVSMSSNDSFDEGPHARRVANFLGTKHTDIVAEPATVDLLPMLARQFDEPIADSSMVPTYLLSVLIRQHAKVALGGDGGDELFGGYAHHRWIMQHERIRHYTRNTQEGLARGVSHMLPPGARGRNYLAALGEDRARSIARATQYFDAGWRARLAPALAGLTPDVLWSPETYKAQLSYTASTPLQQVTSVDFHMYLPADILVKVDRSSMLTSLEVRAPWLDHRIVEFAFGKVPDHLRTAGKVGKILPKMIVRRLLPDQVKIQRKQGFSIPLHAWFKGEWGKFMEGILTEAPAELFNPGVVRSLIRLQRMGFSNTSRVFALVMLELWRREYTVDLPGE